MELLPDAESFGLLESVDIVCFYDQKNQSISYYNIDSIIFNFKNIDSYGRHLIVEIVQDFDIIKTKILGENEIFEYILNINSDYIILKNKIKELNNCKLIWFWEIENNRGYKDGLQFEFRNEENKIYKLQLLCMSKIEIYILEKYKLD